MVTRPRMTLSLPRFSLSPLPYAWARFLTHYACLRTVLYRVFVQSCDSSPLKAEPTKTTNAFLRVTGTVPNILSRLLKWCLEVFCHCPITPKNSRVQQTEWPEWTCQVKKQSSPETKSHAHILTDKPPVTSVEITPEPQQLGEAALRHNCVIPCPLHRAPYLKPVFLKAGLEDIHFPFLPV